MKLALTEMFGSMYDFHVRREARFWGSLKCLLDYFAINSACVCTTPRAFLVFMATTSTGDWSGKWGDRDRVIAWDTKLIELESRITNDELDDSCNYKMLKRSVVKSSYKS
jgi:hypothetical protein